MKVFIYSKTFFAFFSAVNIRSGSFLFRNHHDEGPLGPFCPENGRERNFDHFRIEMKIKIMSRSGEKKNEQHIIHEFIQAVLMTSESMIPNKGLRAAKSYFRSPQLFFHLLMVIFILTFFFAPEPRRQPFHSTTGESIDVISSEACSSFSSTRIASLAF